MIALYWFKLLLSRLLSSLGLLLKSALNRTHDFFCERSCFKMCLNLLDFIREKVFSRHIILSFSKLD